MLQLVFKKTKLYFPFSLQLPNYYSDGDEWSLLCSSGVNNGEVRCNSQFIPPYKNINDTECTMSYDSYYNLHYLNQSIINSTQLINQSINTNISSNCINWNMYYTACLPNAKNPFYGAISFDNTGEAFIAIFQVSLDVFII